MKRIIGIVAILIAALPIASSAQSQRRSLPGYTPPRIIIRPQPPPPPNPSGHRYVDMDYPTPEKRASNLAELLGLSDDQRDKAKEIFVQQDKDAAAARDDKDLSVQERNKKLAEVRSTAVKKVRDLLTDDQKKKYDALDPAGKPQDKPRLQPDPNSGPLI